MKKRRTNYWCLGMALLLCAGCATSRVTGQKTPAAATAATAANWARGAALNQKYLAAKAALQNKLTAIDTQAELNINSGENWQLAVLHMYEVLEWRLAMLDKLEQFALREEQAHWEQYVNDFDGHSDTGEWSGTAMPMLEHEMACHRTERRLADLLLVPALYKLRQELYGCKVSLNGEISTLTFGELCVGKLPVAYLLPACGQAGFAGSTYCYGVLVPTDYLTLDAGPEEAYLCLWCDGVLAAVHLLGQNLDPQSVKGEFKDGQLILYGVTDGNLKFTRSIALTDRTLTPMRFKY